jgi:hypothetical protein
MSSKKIVPIKYTSRDFDSIKNDLIEHAKRYYSDTYKDFSQASFGSLMLDTVAYVGDILSFYLDYQANESFIDTAVEYNNVLRHAKHLGYKLKRDQSAHGVISLYVLAPASIVGIGPDRDFMPVLKKGSKFLSGAGALYTLNENVDFASDKNEIVVAKVDKQTGLPTHYAIKAFGQVISGDIEREVIDVGPFQKFLKVRIADINITEIVSVVDSEGHEYFEVDYLSQNVVYKPIVNRNKDKNNAPAILKPFVVPRRFVVENEQRKTFLQFGYGSDNEIPKDSIADPSNVVLDMHGKDYIIDDSFDPSNLLATDKFGVAPSNTSIVVTYRTNKVTDPNASVGSINKVVVSNFEFENRSTLDDAKVRGLKDSLEIFNEEPVIGSVSTPSLEELKQMIKNSFASQNRAVTKEDYIAMVYSMPSQFGSIKRINVVQDKDSFKRNLNVYVASEDKNKKLMVATQTLKENLKTWINRSKMINDTIDILDAKIVNIRINFTAVSDINANKYDTLRRATTRLQQYFNRTYEIGEPILLTDIYKTLNDVEGVADTIDVKLEDVTGGFYSDVGFNVFDNLSPDGRILYAPEDCIFEVKYGTEDIKGSIK